MKARRLIIGILGFLVLLLVLLPIAAGQTRLNAMLRILPLGWWGFLKRNIPQLTYNWRLIVTGVLCTLLLVLVGHWFLSTLLGQVQKGSNAAKALGQWRWSWTFGFYATAWVLFLIAFGASGVLRQTTWLFKDNRPWYEERLYASHELRMADGTVQQLLMENNGDLEKSRRAIVEERAYRRSRNPLCEDFNIILYADAGNKVAAHLIIPRNPKLLKKGLFFVSSQHDSESFQPLSQLRDTMAKLETQYPAKASQ